MNTPADLADRSSRPPGPAGFGPQPGPLEILTHDECVELLARGGVGRVAWNDHEGPFVVPVRFALDGPAIVFPMVMDRARARQLHLGLASLQVDDVDGPVGGDALGGSLQAGWSVLARGVLSCTAIDDDGLAGAGASRETGERYFALRITPLILSGRRIARA